MSTPKCPNCGSNMVARNNRKTHEKFWGCPQFPKCRGTRPYQQKSTFDIKPVHAEPKWIENPSVFQQSIFDFVSLQMKSTSKTNLIVKATAGSGKTSTAEHTVNLITKHDPFASIVYLTFDARSARDARRKGLPSSTTHSKFLSDLNNHVGQQGEGRVVLENNKVKMIAEKMVNMETEYHLIAPTAQLISKIKNVITNLDDIDNDEILYDLCIRFNIDVDNIEAAVFDLTRKVLNENNKNLALIDYDDMLWLPFIHNITIKQFDYVIGDEVQDWNPIQLELIKRTVKPNGFVMIVGDEDQSMYGFRGADLYAMQRLEIGLNCKPLPLSITYRCPRSHVHMINKLFPHIDFIAADWAIEGSIDAMSSTRMLGEVADGDIVLCRINAPTIKYALHLIRMGKKAVVLGRDIGQTLEALLNKHEKPSDTLDDVLEKIKIWTEKQILRLTKRDKRAEAERAKDNYDTLMAIAVDCDTSNQVRQRIGEIFSDEVEGTTFSTVHKFKGGEAERIFILRPDLMPGPWAESEEDMKQEENILFVALTRSKDYMCFVDGPPPMKFQNVDYSPADIDENKVTIDETIEDNSLSPIERMGLQMLKEDLVSFDDKDEWTEADDKIAAEVIEQLGLKDAEVHTNVTIISDEIPEVIEPVTYDLDEHGCPVIPECPF